MQSIFYPSHRIEERYDVKGCLAGRYQKPRPPGSTVVTVYKDQNFVDQSLDLGTQGEWFIEQLKADTLFMKELGVQDYSLLIGRQIRHGKYTGKIGKITFPKSLVDKSYLDEINMSNRRLLPNCKNALHIIDGPEYRYFLGIIDFFTLYEYRQRAGRVIKSIKLCCGDHSTIPPGPYADRFLRFITERVK
ncbi:hypothetical protein LOTGIDRAFT_125751 [Lottia gigantea]|uniref:PIPK domain-containing protein n=1 Tax=Lottia gigantea TaxID=225164 RepID=V4A120_LOTGI|nr:hypothetical protein LOTGIDRAFT_125751 [Lottia gigantea]ESO88635.1 hypothetical protein LOTGIDRAFT_125751 [Lottia gigantea]